MIWEAAATLSCRDQLVGERGSSGEYHAPPLSSPTVNPCRVWGGRLLSALLQSCSPKTSRIHPAQLGLSNPSRSLSRWKLGSVCGHQRKHVRAACVAGASAAAAAAPHRPRQAQAPLDSETIGAVRPVCLSPCQLGVVRVTSPRDNHFRLWEPAPEPSPGPATRLPSESRGALPANQRLHRPFRPTRGLPDRRCPVRGAGGHRAGVVCRVVRGSHASSKMPADRRLPPSCWHGNPDPLRPNPIPQELHHRSLHLDLT